MGNDRGPLEKLLFIAVPMWIEKLRWRDFKEFESRRDSIHDSVCAKGDLLLYGSPRKGETAKLFNDLAEGLAWLALIAKGGVDFGNQHWDAEFLNEEEKMSLLRKESEERARQSEKVRAMCGGAEDSPADFNDAVPDKRSAIDDR